SRERNLQLLESVYQMESDFSKQIHSQCSLTLSLLRWIADVDTLDLAKLVNCQPAQFAVAIATGFHATKGEMDFGASGTSIEIDQTRGNITHSPEGLPIALRKDGSG